jgi:hypothetical protein
MPTTFATDWGTVYNKATLTFSKDSQAAAKTDKSVGSLLMKLLEDAQDTAAVLGGLVAMDKIDLSAGSDKQRAALPANTKLFKQALSNFEKEKNRYVKAVEETQKLKITVKDKSGYNLPTPIKEAFPDSHRQLKLLQTEIEAIHARAANALEGALNVGKLDKIQADKQKAVSKAPQGEAGNDTLKAASQEAAMKGFILQFAASFKSSMAKGAAAIQRIKADPTLATYNKEMGSAGRDISQNVVNIDKLKNDPKFKGSRLAKALTAPPDLMAEIGLFGNGNLRNLASTATPNDVKDALQRFTAVYKRIATTYANVIAGKLK